MFVFLIELFFKFINRLARHSICKPALLLDHEIKIRRIKSYSSQGYVLY